MQLPDWIWRFWIPKKSVIDGFTVVTDERVPIHIRKKIYRGQYERSERAAVNQYVALGDRVLEIGTALGVVGLACARRCGGETLHYEPNPATQAIIRENFALNGRACRLKQKAMTAKGGVVRFQVADNIWSSSLFDRGLERTIEVQSDAIEDVIASFRPTVIVMDVEGAELQIVEGSKFDGVRAVIFEVHPKLIGESGQVQIDEHLKAAGFVASASGGGKTKKCLVYLRPYKPQTYSGGK